MRSKRWVRPCERSSLCGPWGYYTNTRAKRLRTYFLTNNTWISQLGSSHSKFDAYMLHEELQAVTALCFSSHATVFSVKFQELGKQSWHKVLHTVNNFTGFFVAGGKKGTLIQGKIRPWKHKGIHKSYVKILW